MRHHVAGTKLGGGKDRGIGIRRNLICQLFEHERLNTTKAKAKAVRGDAERLITLARNSGKGTDVDKMNARRKAAALLGDAVIVKKLFDDIGPRFATRNGGYTRIYLMGPRLGDAAEMVLFELVD